MIMDLVAAASAAGIVRMIAEQILPGVYQAVIGIESFHTVLFKHCVKRLEHIFEQGLSLDVGYLEIMAGGEGSLEDFPVVAASELVFVYGQLDVVFLNELIDRLNIIVHIVLHNGFVLGQLFLNLVKNGEQIGLGLEVVNAVHEQQIGGKGKLVVEAGSDAFNIFIGLVDVGRKTLGIVVPVAQMYGKSLGSVGALPDKLGGRGFALHLALGVAVIFAEASSENEIVDSEVIENLGKLRNVAELVGSITDSAACTKLGGQLFYLR